MVHGYGWREILNMTSRDTYKARIARFLYLQGLRYPRWIAVDDALDAIASPGERTKAYQAVRSAAMDDFSPVRYVEHTGQEAIALMDASTATVEQEVADWIELWDGDELPPDLR
jgi:hypothetical protein